MRNSSVAKTNCVAQKAHNMKWLPLEHNASQHNETVTTNNGIVCIETIHVPETHWIASVQSETDRHWQVRTRCHRTQWRMVQCNHFVHKMEKYGIVNFPSAHSMAFSTWFGKKQERYTLRGAWLHGAAAGYGADEWIYGSLVVRSRDFIPPCLRWLSFGKQLESSAPEKKTSTQSMYGFLWLRVCLFVCLLVQFHLHVRIIMKNYAGSAYLLFSRILNSHPIRPFVCYESMIHIWHLMHVRDIVCCVSETIHVRLNEIDVIRCHFERHAFVVRR